MITNYALILGASSGFGKAISTALAKDGTNIIGVHLDRAQTMPLVEKQLKILKMQEQKLISLIQTLRMNSEEKKC